MGLKVLFFHGSPKKIDGSLSKGTYVTESKYNALLFALRRRKGDAYIYSVLVDPETDIEQRVDAAGVRDTVLTRNMPYKDRFPVTDDVKRECKAEIDPLKP